MSFLEQWFLNLIVRPSSLSLLRQQQRQHALYSLITPNRLTLLNHGLCWSSWLLSSSSSVLSLPARSSLCGVFTLLSLFLDSLDGQLARDTRTSSSTGELLDHGLDALNIPLAAAATLSLAAAAINSPQWLMRLAAVTQIAASAVYDAQVSVAAAVDEMVAPAAGGVEAALLGLVMLLGISIAEVVGDEEVRVAKGWPLVCVLVVVAMVVVVVQWTKFLGMLRNYPMQMKRHGMFILTQGSLAPVLAEARDSRFRREMFVMVCLLNVHLTSAKVFALICKRMHKTVDSRWHWRNYCCCLAFSVLVIGIGLGFENQARDQILTVVGSIFAGFNFFEVYWMDTNR